jgi:hypothetical protein
MHSLPFHRKAGAALKVSVEIDCTPTEARQFFGLPNVERVQQMMLERLDQKMAEATERFSPEALMGSWLSIFPQNAEWLQKAFPDAMGNKKPAER